MCLYIKNCSNKLDLCIFKKNHDLLFHFAFFGIFFFNYKFFFCSVVRFRRTGESTRSEEDVESREQEVRPAEPADLESVALAEGVPVPREFANPTDGALS